MYEKICPTCGKRLSSFMKTAMLGCPDCYTAFESQIISALKNVQGKTFHVGKKPKLDSLEKELLRDYQRLKEEKEKAGLKFREILDDVINFEKGVVLKEFQLANDNGDLLFDGSFKTGLLRATGFCILCGFVWYLLEGQSRTFHNFLEGFFWPFVCILISSILGLPVHFIEKKNPELAKKVRKFGEGFAIVFTIILLLTALVLYIIK